MIWTCCTAISAGIMADGSSDAEGFHMAGTLRADEEAVKESKQGRAEDSLTGWSCVSVFVCRYVTRGKVKLIKNK